MVDRLEREAVAETTRLAERAIELGFMRREKNKPHPVRTLCNIQQAVADAYRVPVVCGEGRNRNKLYPDDKAGARKCLEGFEAHLSDAGIGTLSEIFDAEAPYTPRGCIAQAWTVAEVLRAWLLTEENSKTTVSSSRVLPPAP